MMFSCSTGEVTAELDRERAKKEKKGTKGEILSIAVAVQGPFAGLQPRCLFQGCTEASCSCASDTHDAVASSTSEGTRSVAVDGKGRHWTCRVIECEGRWIAMDGQSDGLCVPGVSVGIPQFLGAA